MIQKIFIIILDLDLIIILYLYFKMFKDKNFLIHNFDILSKCIININSIEIHINKDELNYLKFLHNLIKLTFNIREKILYD